MVINKNNGVIKIEQIRTNTRHFTGVKVIGEYSITVKDRSDTERFNGLLKVIEVRGITKYRLTYNSNNKDLVRYIVKELKKYKYIK